MSLLQLLPEKLQSYRNIVTTRIRVSLKLTASLVYRMLRTDVIGLEDTSTDRPASYDNRNELPAFVTSQSYFSVFGFDLITYTT